MTYEPGGQATASTSTMCAPALIAYGSGGCPASRTPWYDRTPGNRSTPDNNSPVRLATSYAVVPIGRSGRRSVSTIRAR
ncbi:hypothetical protein [Actinoplanes sp. NPDC026670]|uniref:hypothetical protein n=1 Tax=Actinoplanes sp. NPDC026670 TaxID=3154700 RepID=UPI0033F2D166